MVVVLGPLSALRSTKFLPPLFGLPAAHSSVDERSQRVVEGRKEKKVFVPCFSSFFSDVIPECRSGLISFEEQGDDNNNNSSSSSGRGSNIPVDMSTRFPD